MPNTPQIIGTEYTDKGMVRFGEKDPKTGQRFEQFIPISSPYYVKPPKEVSKPVGLLDSSLAESQINKDTNKLQTFQEELGVFSQNLANLQGRIKTEGITETKTPSTGPTTKPETTEITPEEKELADLTKEYTDAIAELDQIRADAKSANQAIIDSIKAVYADRRNKMEDINKRQTASLRAIGYSLGTQRYTPITATGIISLSERQGLDRIKELDNEELMLIADAERAMTEQDYMLLNDKINRIEKLRNEKAEELKEMQKVALERNKEVLERQETIMRQGQVLGLVAQGITDPMSLFSLLNFDEQGNAIGDISLEDITGALDLALTNEVSAFEEVIDKFDDAEGNRTLIVRDKRTGEIKSLQVGLVEKEEEKAELRTVSGVGLVKIQPDGSYEVVVPTGEDSEAKAKSFMSFRQTIRGEKAITTFNDLKLAYNSIFTGFQQNDAAGDLAMISGFARLLDPGSVVRPAEFQTVREAQGVLERAENFLDRVKEGKQMPQDVRDRLFNMANRLITKNAQPIVENLKSTYEPVAKDLDLDFNQVAPEVGELQGIIDVAQGALKGKTTIEGTVFKSPEGEMLEFPDLTPEEEQQLINAGYIKQ